MRFRVMIRVKLDSSLQLVKALRNVGNLLECHTTLEKGSGTNGTGKITKDLDVNPTVVNSESLVDIVIGVGESGT